MRILLGRGPRRSRYRPSSRPPPWHLARLLATKETQSGGIRGLSKTPGTPSQEGHHHLRRAESLSPAPQKKEKVMELTALLDAQRQERHRLCLALTGVLPCYCSDDWSSSLSQTPQPSRGA